MLIERGHKIYCVISDKNVKTEVFRKRPCDADRSCPTSVRYISNNFGLRVRHYQDIVFTRDKKTDSDIQLCYDDHNKDAFGLPYNTPYCHWKGKTHLVGYPLAQLIRESLCVERPGTALIIHPGGGRGYISPQRKSTPKEEVTALSIRFFQEVLDNLPKGVKRVRIKTHPLPYHRCTKSAIEKFVVPELKTNRSIRVVEDDMITHLVESEYIINFGGTSSLWLIGSGKKWCNIVGMDWHNARREKLIPKRGGGIPLDQLPNLKKRDEDSTVYNLDTRKLIMGKMNELLGI